MADDKVPIGPLLEVLGRYATKEDNARHCRIAAHNPLNFADIIASSLAARHNNFTHLPPPQAETLLAHHKPVPGRSCCVQLPSLEHDRHHSLSDYVTLPSGEVVARGDASTPAVGAPPNRPRSKVRANHSQPAAAYELSCRILGTAQRNGSSTAAASEERQHLLAGDTSAAPSSGEGPAPREGRAAACGDSNKASSTRPETGSCGHFMCKSHLIELQVIAVSLGLIEVAEC